MSRDIVDTKEFRSPTHEVDVPIIVFGIRRLLYVDDSGEAVVSEVDDAEVDED